MDITFSDVVGVVVFAAFAYGIYYFGFKKKEAKEEVDGNKGGNDGKDDGGNQNKV